MMSHAFSKVVFVHGHASLICVVLVLKVGVEFLLGELLGFPVAVVAVAEDGDDGQHDDCGGETADEVDVVGGVG